MRAGRTLSLVALLWAAIAGDAAAQAAAGAVAGRILGPDNAPLGGQAVVLHRVQEASGATVSQAVTAGDGRFTLALPTSTDTAAIYFVATRYEGELYIGAPFRAGEQNPAGEVIQVGIPGTSATAMLGGGATMPQTVGRPLTSRNWLLLVIPLLGVAAVALYALIPRRRLPEDRALLIRIAELDERMSSMTAGERHSLLEERSRLTTQLKAG